MDNNDMVEFPEIEYVIGKYLLSDFCPNCNKLMYVINQQQKCSSCPDEQKKD